MTRLRLVGLSGFCVLACLLPALHGCTYAKAMIPLLPDPQEEADYVFPKDAVVLIMLDERDTPLTNPRARPVFVQAVTDALMNQKEKPVAKIVKDAELQKVQRNDPDFSRRSVQTLGRWCGATHVIYCEVKKFSLRAQNADPTWTGKMEVSVKVIETATGERVWPNEREGRIFDADSPQEVSDAKDFADRLANRLALELGGKVAKSFYKHDAETVRNKPSHVHDTQ